MEQGQCSQSCTKMCLFYHFIFTTTFYRKDYCYLYVINEQTKPQISSILAQGGFHVRWWRKYSDGSADICCPTSCHIISALFSFKWNLLVFYWWCLVLFERKAVTIAECCFLFLLILLGKNCNIFRVYKGVGLCIHCEKIFIIGLINTFITSDNLFGKWECKFYFMQILLYNTVSSTLGSNLIWTLDFQTSYNAKFIPFYQLLPIPPTTPLAALGKHHSTLLLWVQPFFF